MPATQPPTPEAAALCIRCQYPLPDLSPGAVCPECATPAEGTLRGYGLASSSASYLSALTRGLDLMVWSMALTALVLFWNLAVPLSQPAILYGFSADWTLQLLISFTAIGILWPLGALRFTVREEPVRGPQSSEVARRWMRRTALPLAATACGVWVLLTSGQIWEGALSSPIAGGLAIIGAAMLAAAALAQFVMALLYLHQVAGRIPAPAVRRGIYVVAATVAVAATGIIALELFASTWLSMGCLTLAAILVLPVLFGSVLYAVRHQIRGLLRQAREREVAGAARSSASP